MRARVAVLIGVAVIAVVAAEAFAVPDAKLATARNPAAVGMSQRPSLSLGPQAPAGDPDLEPGFPVQTYETSGGYYAGQGMVPIRPAYG
jgi:hypothetical protein